jgi:hypothetical protein
VGLTSGPWSPLPLELVKSLVMLCHANCDPAEGVADRASHSLSE